MPRTCERAPIRTTLTATTEQFRQSYLAANSGLGCFNDVVFWGLLSFERCFGGFWQLIDDMGGEAEDFHDTDDAVGEVEFPQSVSVSSHSLVGMMIVVPAFAEGEQADPPEVSRAVAGLVIAIAPDMSGGIDEPGDVVDDDDPGAHGPQEDRESQAPSEFTDEEEGSGREEQERPVGGVQESLQSAAVKIGCPSLEMYLEIFGSVSRLQPEEV